MVIRPVDENGDILPVLESASLFRGVDAESRVIRDRLDLLAGDRAHMDEEMANTLIYLFHDYLLGRRCTACGHVFMDTKQEDRCPRCGASAPDWDL